VTQIPKEQAREIWHLYSAFENSYGDLASLARIENRKAALYSEQGNITLSAARSDTAHADHRGIMKVVHRYRYLDLWPCSFSELEAFDTLSLQKDDAVAESKEESIDPFRQLKDMHRLSRFPKPDLSQVHSLQC
jgi:hypothetical protein